MSRDLMVAYARSVRFGAATSRASMVGRHHSRRQVNSDRGARSDPLLWELRPYFRQVAGQLVLGSIAGIVMNTAVVLPALMLGRAIDTALAYQRGAAGETDLAIAALG